MCTSTSLRWLVVVAGAAMLLAVVAACAGETVEVPGETVVVEKVVTETVEVPGETVVVEKEVIRTVEVPGETVTKEVVKEVMVPGETVVVEKEVVKTVEVPGQTVVKEVVKTVEVPGQTVVVEKEVVKTVEVPGATVVVTKEVAGPERVVVKEVRAGYVTDPTTGKVVSAPQYGGTLTYSERAEPPQHTDPWLKSPRAIGGVVEKLGIGNWAIDRDEWGFAKPYLPLRFITGWLAESWEMTDPLTYVFNIRKGVHWHDKPPMNGRELTADDIKYHIERNAGLGKFSEAGPSPRMGTMASIPFESITATDKYTVVVKLKEPRVDTPEILLAQYNSAYIMPPEVIKEHGGVTDWRNLVGTGPFMLTDWVKGTSLTKTRNPDYWGYDEKYPENRLPYIDQLRRLIMKEEATRLAALRSGKIDYIGPDSTQLTSVDQAESLQRTNPEIVLWPFAFRSETSAAFNLRRQSLFNDIRVRKAMQMAIDLETINNAYFKGLASWKPQGLLGESMKGFYVPFEDWPEDVKKVFDYDSEGAEALLDEAGYPRGADGIRFKTVHNPLATWHLGYHEILVEYWAEIGVDVEIQVHEQTDLSAMVREGTYEGMTFIDLGVDGAPGMLMDRMHSRNSNNRTGHQDPVFDSMLEAAMAATTVEEQQRLVAEADMYIIEQQFYIWGPKVPQFGATQPWVIGFNGDFYIDITNPPSFARLWIDSELKEAMGH